MHRIDTTTALPGGAFTEGDPTIPVAATEVSADWLNAVQEELVAVILAAGIELAKTSNGQLLAAIRALMPQAATTTLAGLVELATAAETVALADATRAVTPAGLAELLPGAATTEAAGLVELAVNAEVAALADTSRAVTPSGLGSLFGRSLGASGYQKFPGGLVMQWGVTSVALDATVTVTLPLAFATAFYAVVACMSEGTPGQGVSISGPAALPVSLTQFTLGNDNAAQSIYWIALGR